MSSAGCYGRKIVNKTLTQTGRIVEVKYNGKNETKDLRIPVETNWEPLEIFAKKMENAVIFS